MIKELFSKPRPINGSEFPGDMLAEGIKPQAQTKSQAVAANCGANAPGGGGFQRGNTCGKKGGATKEERKESLKKPRLTIKQIALAYESSLLPANPAPDKLPQEDFESWVRALADDDQAAVEELREQYPEILSRDTFAFRKAAREAARSYQKIAGLGGFLKAPPSYSQDLWDLEVEAFTDDILEGGTNPSLVESDHEGLAEARAAFEGSDSVLADYLSRAATAKLLVEAGGVEELVDEISGGLMENSFRSGDYAFYESMSWQVKEHIPGISEAIGAKIESRIMSGLHRDLNEDQAEKLLGAIPPGQEFNARLAVADQALARAKEMLADTQGVSEAIAMADVESRAGNGMTAKAIRENIGEIAEREAFRRGDVTRESQIKQTKVLQQQYADVRDRLESIRNQVETHGGFKDLETAQKAKVVDFYAQQESGKIAKNFEFWLQRMKSENSYIYRKEEVLKTGVLDRYTEIKQDIKSWNGLLKEDFVERVAMQRVRETAEYKESLGVVTPFLARELFKALPDRQKNNVTVAAGVPLPEFSGELNPFDRSDPSYPATQSIVREIQKFRTVELAMERMQDVPSMERTAAVSHVLDETFKDWKRSSTSNMGKALQLAAVEELGAVGKPEYAINRIDIVNGLDQRPEIARQRYEALKAYTRATWEASQYALEKAGRENVIVWRGLQLDGSNLGGGVSGKKLRDLRLLRNGAASATVNPDVANDWGGVGDLPNNARRVVLRIDAGREDVLSLPAFGDNDMDEQEVIVMGSRWNRWDAWLDHAPSSPDDHWDEERLKKSMGYFDESGLVIDMEPDGVVHWMSGIRAQAPTEDVVTAWLNRMQAKSKAAVKDNCGANAQGGGGFQPGNKCSSKERGGGGGGDGKYSKLNEWLAKHESDRTGADGDSDDDYMPDIELDEDGDGVPDYSKVGVPAYSVPPPPKKIPRLPKLTRGERIVESTFADYYEKDPDGVAKTLRQKMADGEIGDGPHIFATDEAKLLHPAYSGKLENRGIYNCALHQTANAIAKRAFVQHLDEVVAKLPKDQQHVLVTAGGVAAGKGFALANNKQVSDVASSAAAVWDSAGEQNSTELPWVMKELKKRGMKGTFVYVHADPKNTWTNPAFGAVQRAKKKGRMVDAHLFADSYTHGAKNFEKFWNKHDGNEDHQFFFIDSSKGKPTQVDRMPQGAVDVDREKLYEDSVKFLLDSDSPEFIKQGGSVGLRIWGKGKIKA